MSLADNQYLAMCRNILRRGTQQENRTGMPTMFLNHQMMYHDLSVEFPILQTKFVAFKTAIKELLWIWQLQSNDVRQLQAMNVKVWDEWMREDGTIGKAYGYQLARLYQYNDVDPEKAKKMHSLGQIKNFKLENNKVYLSQVDKLLYDLKYNKNSRRMIVSLWNVKDLHDMALQPCAYETLWSVNKDKLDCMLIQRSADTGLGLPFNISQYSALIHMIAQVSDLQPGIFTHVIGNAHIYINHIDAITEQMKRSQNLWRINKIKPKIKLNETIKSFYDFQPGDITLENYSHMGKLPMEVSV